MSVKVGTRFYFYQTAKIGYVPVKVGKSPQSPGLCEALRRSWNTVVSWSRKSVSGTNGMYRMRPFILTGCYNHHFIALPLIEFSSPACFVSARDFILSLPTADASAKFLAPTVHTSSKYYDYFSLTRYSISYLTTVPVKIKCLLRFWEQISYWTLEWFRKDLFASLTPDPSDTNLHFTRSLAIFKIPNKRKVLPSNTSSTPFKTVCFNIEVAIFKWSFDVARYSKMLTVFFAFLYEIFSMRALVIGYFPRKNCFDRRLFSFRTLSTLVST